MNPILGAALRMLFVGSFFALIANHYLLAWRVRKFVASERMGIPALENLRFGVSPIGVALTLYRLRKVPAPDALSDPDHVAIWRRYRAQQALAGVFVTCIAVMLFLGFQARTM